MYKPKLFGQLARPDDLGLESGTIIITSNAWTIQQNPRYHANGNIKTHKIISTLEDLKKRAKIAARSVDPLGKLGTTSITSVNYTRAKGGILAQMLSDSGVELVADYTFTPQATTYAMVKQIFSVCIDLQNIFSANLYDVDGQATDRLKSIKFDTTNSDCVFPPAFALYTTKRNEAGQTEFELYGIAEKKLDSGNTYLLQGGAGEDLSDKERALVLIPVNLTTPETIPQTFSYSAYYNNASTFAKINTLMNGNAARFVFYLSYVSGTPQTTFYDGGRGSYTLSGPDKDNKATFTLQTEYGEFETGDAPLYNGTIQTQFYSLGNK